MSCTYIAAYTGTRHLPKGAIDADAPVPTIQPATFEFKRPLIGSITARNCPKAGATDGLFVLTVFISDLYPASIRPVIFATLLTAQGNSCAH